MTVAIYILISATIMAAFYTFNIFKMISKNNPSDEEYLEMYKLKEEQARIRHLYEQGIDGDLHDVTKI